jgi:putative OPT family oligopeptide transporter
METRKGLRPEAYEEIPGDDYIPYVPASESQAEFTIKAIILGSIFGVIFGSANAYLGLRVGLTISTSIPIAVMTVAVFGAFRKVLGRSTILENNIAKTAGSASSSLASGLIFTIPALFLWGMHPNLFQVTMLALAGGVLGVLYMVPLRRFLIKDEHGRLPYPEGTASAEVLVAAEVGGATARNVFTGMGIAALYKWLMDGLVLFKDAFWLNIPFIKRARIGVDVSPALLGVGYILGFRISSIMVAGGLLASVVLIPLVVYLGESSYYYLLLEKPLELGGLSDKEVFTALKIYIRYIGAGAVATAGFITLFKSIPTMVKSFKIGVKQFKERLDVKKTEKRTDRDLRLPRVAIGVLMVTLALICIPHLFGDSEPFYVRVIGAFFAAIFAFFFVTVSARIVGLVGVTSNPTSGMVIATLLCTSLLFLVLGWTDIFGKVAALCIGTVVGVAASIAGDTSQDLKTGFLLGATPWKQQISEVIGVLTTAFFIAFAIFVLQKQYGFGPDGLAAPQAKVMKLVIDGVIDQNIPWRLILLGAGIAFVVHFMKVPSLPFAVGVYLSITTMMPIFVGGLIRKVVEGRCKDNQELVREKREKGVLFGSGLVGGDGLMGVCIAFYAGIVGQRPEGFGTGWAGNLGWLVTAGVFFLLAYLLVRSTKTKAS